MNEDLRNEIIRRWREGMSQRGLAGALGLSRATIQRVLAKHEAERRGETSESLRRPSVLDAYEPAIRELVGRYPEITVTRLLEELRAQGFTGGYTIVRERLQAVRPRAVPAPVVRFETAPGTQAQMDYSPYDIDFTEEGRRRVHAFSYVLGYSRRMYLRFVESQDFATTIQQHVLAFLHLGGVAATCLYDNMKVVVTGHHDDVPIYNVRFLAFATHYGFRPVACRPRRPQTKGKVERPFHYVEVNLLNGRTFRSLAHLNEVATRWLAEVADVRIHRETKQSPQMEAEVARHALLPSTQSQQKQLDPAHHPAPNDVRQRQAAIKQRYEELGSVAVRFLEGLVKTQRYHGDQARRVLGFLGTYSRADVLAALERAARYGAYAAVSVERILASQARPLSLLEKLATQAQTEHPYGDESPAIEPRSTKEYQPLLTEDSANAAPPPIEPSPNEPKNDTKDHSKNNAGNNAGNNDTEDASTNEECPF